MTLYLPLGVPFRRPEWGGRQEWGTLVYHRASVPPIPGKRFRRGIGDQLAADVFNPAAYEALSDVERRRPYEVWLRHSPWEAATPGAFEVTP